MQINVQGGTNAGWDTAKRAASDASPWECKCGHVNPRYWVTCQECNTRRS